MAEARTEEEEENMRRDAREQVVRRQPNGSGGRPDRRKPEHRHSQGPLSSIRAAIKRTSRSTSLSESSRDRDRERERDRDRDRDRRRPEITILSAEPLASTSWFPGASGGFPPPPPPAAQIWGPTIPPSIQPPPSYEEVIREKTQEQVLLPPPSSCPSYPSSSSPRPAPSITTSTQTDPGSAPDLPADSQARRPLRPPRPRLPQPPRPPHVDDATATASQSTLTSLDSDGVVPSTHPEAAAHTHCCNLLTELCSPLTSTSSAQTDQWDQSLPTTSSNVPSERPRPRPRSRLCVQPISSEVKVQTLVKLREDGLATLAARTGTDAGNQEVSQGKYLQELLEAFSADDWGFPERRSDSSEHSQSESEDEDEEDMATLKARIQAFEQQQVADGSCGDGNNRDFAAAKKPEPRPRPRLQGQPAKSAPPTVAPKPKNFSHAPKPSTKVFWEDGGASADSEALKTTETSTTDVNPQPATEPTTSCTPRPGSEKPSITPKPPSATEIPAPVPAPRPPPPKLTPSVSDTPPPANPKPPPRPPVAPRASVGALSQDKSTTCGHTTPTLPPRPSVEVGGGAQTEAGTNETQDASNQTAPNLAPKPAGVSSPDSNPAPPKPTAAAPVMTPKPSASPTPGLKPPTPAPAPAMRKGPVIQTKPDTTIPNPSDPPLPPRPSSVKLLPLRPPPIKSTPGRPPPPSINSTSSANQTTTTSSKTSPAPFVSPASQSSPSQTTSSSSSPASANQMQSQRAPKRGPPLPPRPKPGHPLYSSYAEVLIVLDDPSPSEHLSGEGRSQPAVTPLISPSQCLLDLDTQPEPAPDQDSQSKPALDDLSLSVSQSILPVQPAELKEQPDSPPASGPRCVALFDYEGEEDDELTFSQGDVIALLELIGQEWGRGQIHGRIGIFPLNFTEVVEPPPQTAPPPGETAKPTSTDSTATESTAPPIPEQQSAAKGVAKFDFTAESEDELTLKVGDIITQVESVDEQWIVGVVAGKRGVVPKNYISLL
ncbi:SH3 domain-containing protein 19 [Collichthys lucidus]|uniref:SH3 domain-containing protein 19 n=1 Tax=Collichthys lucidus TaxID=240159 RepID=A0A4V6AV16_COLLU|nr:SH3 domain-containing protein 19 [Collichthys lucidus]